MRLFDRIFSAEKTQKWLGIAAGMFMIVLGFVIAVVGAVFAPGAAVVAMVVMGGILAVGGAGFSTYVALTRPHILKDGCSLEDSDHEGDRQEVPRRDLEQQSIISEIKEQEPLMRKDTKDVSLTASRDTFVANPSGRSLEIEQNAIGFEFEDKREFKSFR